MTLPRPDLSDLSPTVLAYIQALETEIERLSQPARARRAEADAPAIEFTEPPTSINLITLSAGGWIKRTPRHFYGRQRRGGMGVFDLDLPETDRPHLLAAVDEAESLILLTSRGRAFRLAIGRLAEAPVRSRGVPLAEQISLAADETVVCALPAGGGAFLNLVTERGQVRRYSAHLFGESMRAGLAIHDIREGGAPRAACWTTGDQDLFIATRLGAAIRFSERHVPVRGCLGIRLEREDAVAAVAGVDDGANVFLLGADGKGTLRQMAGFRPNKTPGAGGKEALKTDSLIAACSTGDADDLFVISRLSKIIRFQSVEVPAKEGVVQGVNCMDLRADETVAALAVRLDP